MRANGFPICSLNNESEWAKLDDGWRCGGCGVCAARLRSSVSQKKKKNKVHFCVL